MSFVEETGFLQQGAFSPVANRDLVILLVNVGESSPLDPRFHFRLGVDTFAGLRKAAHSHLTAGGKNGVWGHGPVITMVPEMRSVLSNCSCMGVWRRRLT